MDREEEACGVEQLGALVSFVGGGEVECAYGVGGEEDQFLGQDRAPDYGCQDPDAALCDCCGAWGWCQSGSWTVCADTDLSIGFGTEAVLLPGSHRLVVRGEAPLRSDRAPQRHLAVSQLLTPLCVPKIKTGVEEVRLQLHRE